MQESEGRGGQKVTYNYALNLSVRPVTRLAILAAELGAEVGGQGARPSRPAG